MSDRIEASRDTETDEQSAEVDKLVKEIREASRDEAHLREYALRQLQEKARLEKIAEYRMKIINKAYRDHLNQEILSPLAFPDRLLASIRAARETGGVIAIVAGDLDNFKKYNDQEGHPAGDRILAEAGDALNEMENAVIDPTQIFAGKKAISEAGQRASDIATQTSISDLILDLSAEPSKPTVTRKGGDEYVALWPGTVNGLLVAARAQQLFAEKQAKLERENERPMPRVGMTLGIRLVDFSSEQLDPDDRVVAKLALQDADDALYVAKQTQKGSILEHNPTDPRIQARQAIRKTA